MYFIGHSSVSLDDAAEVAELPRDVFSGGVRVGTSAEPTEQLVHCCRLSEHGLSDKARFHNHL